MQNLGGAVGRIAGRAATFRFHQQLWQDESGEQF
jgi:hypothetical protein